jgi:hypothetical protein
LSYLCGVFTHSISLTSNITLFVHITDTNNVQMIRVTNILLKTIIMS